MVRLGIIGVGNMGSGHADNILAGKVSRVQLAAVCDIDESKLHKWAGKRIKTFVDAAELIRSGEVDAVLVATPHYFHTTIGADAMQQGLHLLSEKPISVHVADCKRLIAAHQGGGQVFAAMFNQRTDPRHQALRRLVQSGELGEIQRVNYIITSWFRPECYYRSGGWRATWAGEGGGVLMNQCPHNLDLLQWIVGMMPSRVTASLGWGRYHDIEVEDDVTALLEYPNGASGVFVTTTGEAPGTCRLELAGDRGKVVLEHSLEFVKTEVSVKEFSQRTKEAFGAPATWTCEYNGHNQGWGGQHCEVLQNFVNVILDGGELIAPAAEGIRSVELANAMIMSGKLGRPVDLPLDDTAYEAMLQSLIASSTYQKQVDTSVAVDMAASAN